MSGSPDQQVLEALDVGVVEQFLAQQYNIIERIKAGFDVDDDGQAVMIALQLDILNTLRGQPIDVPDPSDVNVEVVIEEITPEVVIEGDEEGDISIDQITQAEMEQAVFDALQQTQSGRLISFPEDGRPFSFPAGNGAGSRHEVDLQAGSVDVNGVGTKQMSNSLADFDEAEVARSAQLWVDDAVVIRTYDTLDQLTGVWELDLGYVILDATVIERVEIDAVRPFNARFQFGTGQDPPVAAAPVSAHQRRYGHLRTSQQTLQTIPFAGPNFQDYSEANLNDAADNFGVANLYGRGIGTHHWIVQNTESTDAEVQARVFDIAGEQEAADEDIHGSVSTANTNAVTVSANDFAFLESSITGAFFQLLGQSSDGNAVELEAQYLGTTPVRR